MKVPLLPPLFVSIGDYGFGSYLETAAQIGKKEKSNSAWVIGRMLAARALFGLAANEYAQFSLHRKPFSQLRDYRTKKQTSAFINRINPLPGRRVAEDKLVFHRICVEANLPAPPVRALLSRDAASISGVPVYQNFGAAIAPLLDADDVRLFIKPRYGTLGNGIRFVRLHRGEMFDMKDQRIDRQKAL